MRRISFILAVHIAVFSTQPLWPPLGSWLFSGCGDTEMTCSEPVPTGKTCDAANLPSNGCCAPFQCCFPCCCFCHQIEVFTLAVPPVKKIRPSETTGTLHSQCGATPDQPPEMPAHA